MPASEPRSGWVPPVIVDACEHRILRVIAGHARALVKGEQGAFDRLRAALASLDLHKGEPHPRCPPPGATPTPQETRTATNQGGPQ